MFLVLSFFHQFEAIFSVEPNRTKVYLLAEWLLAFSGIHELTKFENVVLRFYIKSVVNLHITCYTYVRLHCHSLHLCTIILDVRTIVFILNLFVFVFMVNDDVSM